MIAIVDYGVGNLFSLKSSFAAIGVEAIVTDDPTVIRAADKIILPGVGAFGDAAEKLRASGLDLATYFKYTGLTLDSLREQMRPQAERQVKARLALEKIAELENLQATEEDVEGEYKNIADAYGVDLDQVKASIDSEAIAADMKVKKAMDLVKEKAAVTTK